MSVSSKKSVGDAYTDVVYKYDALMHQHGQVLGLLRRIVGGFDSVDWGEVVLMSSVERESLDSLLLSVIQAKAWLGSLRIPVDLGSTGGVMLGTSSEFAGDVVRWTDVLVSRVSVICGRSDVETLRVSLSAHEALKVVFPEPHGMVEINGVLVRTFPGLKRLQCQLVMSDGAVKSGLDVLDLSVEDRESLGSGWKGMFGLEDLEVVEVDSEEMGHDVQWKHVIPDVRGSVKKKWENIKLDDGWDLK